MEKTLEQELLQLIKELEAKQIDAEKNMDECTLPKFKSMYLGEINEIKLTVFKLKTILQNHGIITTPID